MSERVSVRDIVERYLRERGYDGLVSGDEFPDCGCGLDDLMPCGSPIDRCQPAYACVIPEKFRHLDPTYQMNGWKIFVNRPCDELTDDDWLEMLADPEEVLWLRENQ